jgi:hypothetical protein
MTSFSFILGVVPLLMGHGAGAEMRRTLGVAVFSGMLGVTVFGIFLTPVFFYVIEGFAETPIFAATRMRLVGKVLVYITVILTLGIPWLLMLMVGIVRRRAVQQPRKSFVVMENGAGFNGFHSENGEKLARSASDGESHHANGEKLARTASDGETEKPVAGAPG